jgi:hypothetical protein
MMAIFIFEPCAAPSVQLIPAATQSSDEFAKGAAIEQSTNAGLMKTPAVATYRNITA